MSALFRRKQPRVRWSFATEAFSACAGAPLQEGVTASRAERHCQRMLNKVGTKGAPLCRKAPFPFVDGCAVEHAWTEYRFASQTLEGFVSQVVRYITKGYRYYVTGFVPERVAELRKVDRKLVSKYQVDLPRWVRARRKKLGYANLRYLRYGRLWVLFATDGRHEFKQAEEKNLRDIWYVPLRVGGYSISMKQGGFLRKRDKSYVRVPGTERRVPREALRLDPKRRAHVRLDEVTYTRLRDYFLSLATHRSRENLEELFYQIPFEPYAPVREQVKRILIHVNRARRHAGFERVPYSALRYHRKLVKVFEPRRLDVAA